MSCSAQITTDERLKEKLERAQMLVMPDIDDPFVPLGSDGLFVDPYKSKYVHNTTRLDNELTKKINHHFTPRSITSFILRHKKSRTCSPTYP